MKGDLLVCLLQGKDQFGDIVQPEVLGILPVSLGIPVYPLDADPRSLPSLFVRSLPYAHMDTPNSNLCGYLFSIRLHFFTSNGNPL